MNKKENNPIVGDQSTKNSLSSNLHPPKILVSSFERKPIKRCSQMIPNDWQISWFELLDKLMISRFKSRGF